MTNEAVQQPNESGAPIKLLSIVGSPRVNGNTHFLAQKFCEGASRDGGCITEEIILNKKKLRGCNHCDSCLGTGICAIKDDQAEILEKMRQSDAFLFSSPVYCFSVTAQMKALFDRCWSMTRPTWDDANVQGKPVFYIVGSAYPLRQEPWYVLHHKMRIESLLCIDRIAKLAEGSTPLKSVLDPMVPYDATSDTLKVMFQMTAGILGMAPLGYIAAEGLGHDKKAIQHRSDDLENALISGAKFAMMAKLMKYQVQITPQ